MIGCARQSCWTRMPFCGGKPLWRGHRSVSIWSFMHGAHWAQLAAWGRLGWECWFEWGICVRCRLGLAVFGLEELTGCRLLLGMSLMGRCWSGEGIGWQLRWVLGLWRKLRSSKFCLIEGRHRRDACFWRRRLVRLEFLKMNLIRWMGLQPQGWLLYCPFQQQPLSQGRSSDQ